MLSKAQPGTGLSELFQVARDDPLGAKPDDVALWRRDLPVSFFCPRLHKGTTPRQGQQSRKKIPTTDQCGTVRRTAAYNWSAGAAVRFPPCGEFANQSAACTEHDHDEDDALNHQHELADEGEI